jgi:hypothetical protein
MGMTDAFWAWYVARGVAIHNEGLRIGPFITKAAALTNRPDLADELRKQWYIGTREGVRRRDRGTYCLIAEDVAGILLVAHEQDPETFSAALAADAAAVSVLLHRGQPKPVEIAAARWRPLRAEISGR